MDEEIIRESDMPHWMELDTLYTFSFENEHDDSEFKEKIGASQLTVVEPVKGEGIKGNYSLIIETKDQYIYFGTKYCKEMNRWVSALRKAKQTVEEISRTKNQILNKNVDSLVALYKQKVSPADQKSEVVLKKCLQELTAHTSKVDPNKTDLNEFLKVARAAQASFMQVDSP